MNRKKLKILKIVKLQEMEQTLVILKPSAIERNLIGEVIGRIEKRGLIICGIKMIQLDEAILRELFSSRIVPAPAR